MSLESLVTVESLSWYDAKEITWKSKLRCHKKF